MNRWCVVAGLAALLLGRCASDSCGGGDLVVSDLVVGSGSVAQAGNRVQLHFLLQDPQGVVLENTYGGAPVELLLEPADAEFVFGLPGQAVLEGILGMQVGGQRTLSVPPGRAYGADYPSQCQSIRYTVELLSVD